MFCLLNLIAYIGYGGFPPVGFFIQKVWRKISSKSSQTRGIPLVKTLSRLEVPRTQTLQPPGHSEMPQRRDPLAKTVPYLSFKTTVGKNSKFEDLTEEQKEEQELQDLKTIGLFWLTAAADLHERVHKYVVSLPAL